MQKINVRNVKCKNSKKKIILKKVNHILSNDCLDEETIEHLKKAEEDIANGRTYPAEEVFKKMREKYGY